MRAGRRRPDSREGYGANKVAAERCCSTAVAPVRCSGPPRCTAQAPPPREWVFVKRALDRRPGAARAGAAGRRPSVRGCQPGRARRGGRGAARAATSTAPTLTRRARSRSPAPSPGGRSCLGGGAASDDAPVGLGRTPWDVPHPIVLDTTAARRARLPPVGDYAATVADEVDWLAAAARGGRMPSSCPLRRPVLRAAARLRRRGPSPRRSEARAHGPRGPGRVDDWKTVTAAVSAGSTWRRTSRPTPSATGRAPPACGEGREVSPTSSTPSPTSANSRRLRTLASSEHAAAFYSSARELRRRRRRLRPLHGPVLGAARPRSSPISPASTRGPAGARRRLRARARSPPSSSRRLGAGRRRRRRPVRAVRRGRPRPPSRASTCSRPPAEQLPFPDDAFDAALAQLVVHFMSDPVAGLARDGARDASGRRRRRVRLGSRRRPGAAQRRSGRRLASSTRTSSDESGSPAPREGHLARAVRGGRAARGRGGDARRSASSTRRFEEWWEPFTLGVGPAGVYVTVARRGGSARRCASAAATLLPEPPFTVTARRPGRLAAAPERRGGVARCQARRPDGRSAPHGRLDACAGRVPRARLRRSLRRCTSATEDPPRAGRGRDGRRGTSSATSRRGPDDDDPVVLMALAVMTNLAGWLIGLAGGWAVRRLSAGDGSSLSRLTPPDLRRVTEKSARRRRVPPPASDAPRERERGSSPACSRESALHRLRERPAACSLPRRVVDRERGTERLAGLGGEELPRDHHVAGGIADAKAAPVDDAAQPSVRDEHVARVEVAVHPDRRPLPDRRRRAASHSPSRLRHRSRRAASRSTRGPRRHGSAIASPRPKLCSPGGGPPDRIDLLQRTDEPGEVNLGLPGSRRRCRSRRVALRRASDTPTRGRDSPRPGALLRAAREPRAAEGASRGSHSRSFTMLARPLPAGQPDDQLVPDAVERVVGSARLDRLDRKVGPVRELGG